MQYLPEFLIVASVHLLAVMSPGPDFVMILKNSLVHSRRAGIYSAIGLGLGILVHVSYSLVGIGLIISKSIVLFSIIKYAGALYLIYIGYKSLRAKKIAPENMIKTQTTELGKSQAIKMGFLTNVLNPKATLFFFALFTQVINPETPFVIQTLYGLEMSVATFIWFATVSIILSHSIIRKKFTAIQHQVEKFFGAILILLGIKVAISSTK